MALQNPAPDRVRAAKIIETNMSIISLKDAGFVARTPLFHDLTLTLGPGTPAADFPQQVPEHLKQQRLQALMHLQQEIVAQHKPSDHED